MSGSQPPPKPGESSRLQFAESDPAADAHSHFGLLYESRAEQLAVAIPYIVEGLERGEQCYYAAAGNTEGEIRSALRAAGVDAAAVIESGALQIHDARALYSDAGEFSMEPLLSEMEAMTVQATDRDGYAGLRITAELTWTYDSAIGLDAFLDYEAAINHVFPDTDLVGLCQYDRTRLPADAIDGIVRTHPILTVRETVTANPYYLDPDGDHARLDSDGDPTRLDPVEDDVQQSPPHPEQKLEMVEALQRREQGLTVLTDATPLLMQADRQDIPRIVVSTLRDGVQLPVTGLWLYDRDADELQLKAATGAPAMDASLAIAACADLAWQAYSTDEILTCPDLRDVETSTATPDLRSALFVPVDGDGVLCAAAPTTDAIDATAERVAQAVATTTRTALDRADRERRLEDQHDELIRYTRATRLIRETCRTVADADTRSEIESAVCDHLTALDDVRFAWIGSRDADGITPRAWAGAEQGYLSDVPVSDRDSAPAVRAATTGAPVTVPSIVDQVAAGDWRTAALSRDFRSAISVPITHNDISYGVLTIYAARSSAFGGLLQSVITEIGKLIAHAIHLAEQTTALQKDSFQELEFAITASNFPFLQLSRDASCTVSVQGSLSADGDQTVTTVTVEGTSRDRITNAVEKAVTITDAEFVGESAEGHRVQLTLPYRFIDAALAEHGVALQTVTADPTGARVVVDAPTTVDAQTVLDTIADRYTKTELVAKRQGDRSMVALPELRMQLFDQLTERQLDVLTAAYHAGYFESPRENTGEEVASTLGITAQTFSQHLRRIQRKLFDALLTDGGGFCSSRD